MKRLESVLLKKLFNNFLGLCTYFVQKSVKVIIENHSLKSLIVQLI